MLEGPSSFSVPCKEESESLSLSLGESFRVLLRSYHDSSPSRHSNHVDPDASLAALELLLAATHRGATQATRQGDYRQVVAAIPQALDCLADYEEQFNPQHAEEIKDETKHRLAPLRIWNIELCLLQAKAHARLRDSQKATKILRDCRRLIQQYTSYNSVTEYQQQQQQQRRNKVIQEPPYASPVEPEPNNQRIDIHATTAPVATIEFIADHLTVEKQKPWKTTTTPTTTTTITTESTHHGKDGSLTEEETYTGHSSDSEASDDNHASPLEAHEPAAAAAAAATVSTTTDDDQDDDLPLPPLEQVQEDLLVHTPQLPRLPSPTKSCLRQSPAGNHTHSSLGQQLPTTLEPKDPANLVTQQSFASFACQSTLSAFAEIAANTNSREHPLPPTKRVSFSPLPQQWDDDERAAIPIKAFIPRQKLKMLRDQRLQARSLASKRSACGGHVVSPVAMVERPQHPSGERSRLDRIQELSQKLRKTESDLRAAQQARPVAAHGRC